MNGTQNYEVHKNWSQRPNDERHLSLKDQEVSLRARTEKSRPVISDNQTLRMISATKGDDEMLAIDTVAGPMLLTNWTFGQLCSAVKGPAGFLRTLPASMTEGIVNHLIAKSDRQDNMLYVMQDETEPTLRAFTSTTYGRIFDLNVNLAVQEVNAKCGDRWQIPSATYDKTDPKRATTIYSSDRDIFIFLCDAKNPIIVNGEELLRGFYVWNSEVGACTFGLAQFLYRKCCDNRIIWGVENYSELKIKHTSGAPERFLREGAPMLREYAESSTKQIEDKILRAQEIKLGKDREEVQDFLKKFGMTQAAANGVIEMAQAEEGSFRSVWDIAQGITAKARSIVHTDARVQMERTAGALLDKVLGKSK